MSYKRTLRELLASITVAYGALRSTVNACDQEEVWKESGSPQTGWVYEIRKKTRNDYRRISRWVIRNQEKLRAEKMSESLQTGQQRNFWTEVQRMRRKHNPTIQNVDEVTEQDYIRDLFCEKYKELYNCIAYDETEMEDLLSELNIRVSNCCENGKCYEDHNVSVNHVRDAIKTLKAASQTFVNRFQLIIS
ncbi:hypothetical protein CAPTEDRAFT_185536 [Capitella teleta]|uniref:Uncharacterized protein n=1 Tax=Capitella teleta TaxID=283909 RepID=R7T3K2_CAPTE|nr:hypothetical protein CAPTEDRAFT_185536 [Capitella teleta]|eukprot:ELT87357.1 hypothetical protein CAPTEDRAFT_185536 [Capitella teleta]